VGTADCVYITGSAVNCHKHPSYLIHGYNILTLRNVELTNFTLMVLNTDSAIFH